MIKHNQNEGMSDVADGKIDVAFSSGCYSVFRYDEKESRIGTTFRSS